LKTNPIIQKKDQRKKTKEKGLKDGRHGAIKPGAIPPIMPFHKKELKVTLKCIKLNRLYEEERCRI